jgi:hypothetical protein
VEVSDEVGPGPDESTKESHIHQFYFHNPYLESQIDLFR